MELEVARWIQMVFKKRGQTWYIFNSNKGHKKLYFEGFVYTKNRANDETCYWIYEQKYNYCRGRLTVTNEIVTKRSEHNHAPDPCTPKIQIVMAEMKEQQM